MSSFMHKMRSDQKHSNRRLHRNPDSGITVQSHYACANASQIRFQWEHYGII